MPGAFPQTWSATGRILDDFNRADEGPPPSSNWATGIFAGNPGLRVVSNTLRQVTQNTGSDAYRLDVLGEDHEAYMTVSGYLTNEAYHIYGRLQNIGLGGGGTSNGYMVVVEFNTPNWDVKLNRMTGGAFTQLGTTDTRTAQVTQIGIRCEADHITAVYNDGSGLTLSTVATATDNTYRGASRVGVRLARTGAHVADDFNAGTIASTLVTVPTVYPATHFGPF